MIQPTNQSANTVPANPLIYHIVHIDRLPSIVADGHLWCDTVMELESATDRGTSIGMSEVKDRRRHTALSSHSDLKVGDCVPFYFCPRSVMLYVIFKRNHPSMGYTGGQQPIVHLEADLRATVAWLKKHGQRWSFTLSNAGAGYFEDRCHLTDLKEINWNAVKATHWANQKHGKQAEFLVENKFPWQLIVRIGAYSEDIAKQARCSVATCGGHEPRVEVRRDWYY